MTMLHILQHALGLDQFGRGEPYRNHFVTGEGSIDHPICMEAVRAGLMERRAGNPITGDMDLFLVEDAGRQYVAANSPPPPKLTASQQRYRDWLDVSDVCDLSFIDYCRLKSAERRAA